VLFVALVLLTGCSALSAQTLATPGPGQKYLLDEEFNGSSIDLTKWTPNWFGATVGTTTRQFGDACANPSHVAQPGDGYLHLKVTHDACLGMAYDGALVNTDPSQNLYRGGFQFTFGTVEARVFLPAAKNLSTANWPAVWTNGQHWPNDGENDIMEGLGGSDCYHFHSSPGAWGGCAQVASGWHTFASTWTSGRVTYSYDGQFVGQVTTGVTGAPMYVIIDNTVSTSYGGPTTAPADMLVDYVRVTT
jgi:beta-glucanase (GH16 family)